MATVGEVYDLWDEEGALAARRRSNMKPADETNGRGRVVR